MLCGGREPFARPRSQAAPPQPPDPRRNNNNNHHRGVVRQAAYTRLAELPQAAQRPNASSPGAPRATDPCRAAGFERPSWPPRCSGPRPWVALLTVPAAAVLGIDVASDPQQLAFLYGMTLLGTWTTLIPNKLIESRNVDGTNRRLIALAAGVFVGGVGLVLARILRLDTVPQRAFFENSRQPCSGLFWSALRGLGGMVVAGGARPGRPVPDQAHFVDRNSRQRARAVLALYPARRHSDRRPGGHGRATGEPLE